MSTWILFVSVFSYYGTTVSIAEFDGKSACMSAANEYLRTQHKKIEALRGGTLSLLCVPKGGYAKQ